MDETERLRERVGELIAELTGRYERLEGELLEAVSPEDDQPLGWTGRIATLRVFGWREPSDDWTDLARLMVEPEALGEQVAHLMDISGEDTGAAVRRITDVLDGRILVMAPSGDEAAALVEALADRELPVLLEEVVPPPPFRRREHNGTVEFRSLTESERAAAAQPPAAHDPKVTVSDFGTLRMEVIPDDLAEKTRPNRIVSDEMLTAAAVPPAPAIPVPAAPPEPEPEPQEPDDRPPEAKVRKIVVRPVGRVWQDDAERELRGLQLGLLWIEQWPRDVATVERLEVEGVQRREERRADIAALETAIVDRRAELEASQESVTTAEAERERTAADEAEVAAEAVGPRQEAERLHAEADGAAAQAAEAARVADEAYARVTAIDERTGQARYELGAARDQEQQLIADLARAREELPAAKAETERLVTEDSTAVAEGHASYYRVRAAESAVAAVRGKRTLTQRLHVAPSPPELKKLRADLKDKVRQADDAVKRAHETKEAAERAAQHEASLASFLETGAERLAAAKHAQERLADELAALASEREGAVDRHREHARTAAESADRATQASASARYAEQTARAAEERLAVARTAREIAEAALERAETDVRTLGQRIAQTENALAERRSNAETENAEDESDLAVAVEAEARSREQVAALCGDEEPETGMMPAVQERAMARIEELTRFLAVLADSPHDTGTEYGRMLLAKASVVGGSPFAISAGDPGQFDELVVTGTERLGPDDLLIGAVHARFWTLLTTSDPAAEPAPASAPAPAAEPVAAPEAEHEPAPVEAEAESEAASEPESVSESESEPASERSWELQRAPEYASGYLSSTPEQENAPVAEAVSAPQPAHVDEPAGTPEQVSEVAEEPQRVPEPARPADEPESMDDRPDAADVSEAPAGPVVEGSAPSAAADVQPASSSVETTRADPVVPDEQRKPDAASGQA